MWLSTLLWVKNNWKAILLIGGAVALFGAGWHSNTIYRGYVAQKNDIKAIDRLGKGEVSIVLFNSFLDKEKANVKDPCINATVPTGIVRLLH